MYDIKFVTVVGANGTMGSNISAIFAAFGNAKVYMICRDLEKSKNAIDAAYHSVRAESIKMNMIAADYTMLEECVCKSDIVIETISEDWDTKVKITRSIAKSAEANLSSCRDTIFCTGSSGLSITGLAELFPNQLKQNYIGMHFFNPPYTMTLCEIIPTIYSNRNLVNYIKNYCSSILHRTVVEVKDHPGFLGNRIGFKFINESLIAAEKYRFNGGIDYIDAILGPFTGRVMAPLVTSNFVGLDVHKAIIDNLYKHTDDYAHETFVFPDFACELVSEGHLGRKSGGGLYKTIIHDSGVKIHQVYDIESGSYRNVINYTFPFIETMLYNLKIGDYDKAFHTLITNRSLEAELCCGFLIRYIIYSLSTTELVGYDIHSADDVMAMGFNWCPPLAMIQAFFGIDNFKAICFERISECELERIDLEQLFHRVESSKYDFRKFIKAKR